MRFWSLPDNPPSRPGCLVVPSYALKDRSTPTRPTRAALELAADWWRRYREAVIIVSTGDNQRLGVTNASVMAKYANRLGVPSDHIIEEDRSRNTFENLVFCRELATTAGYREPTLVTLDLYTRRAVAVARKIGWLDLCWVSAYSEGEPAAGYKYLQTHSRFTIGCYEIAAMLYCRLRGWA
jgi:vancomycin permeability regulator SanA